MPTAKHFLFLFLGCTLAFSTSVADAEQLTGCLNRRGNLTKLALGDLPSRPCNSRQTEVSIPLGTTGGVVPNFVLLDGNLNTIGPIVRFLDKQRVDVLIQVQDSSETQRNVILRVEGTAASLVDFPGISPVWYEVAGCPENDPANPPFIAAFTIPGDISASTVIELPTGERRLFVPVTNEFKTIEALSRLSFEGVCIDESSPREVQAAREAELVINDLHEIFPLPYTLVIE